MELEMQRMNAVFTRNTTNKLDMKIDCATLCQLAQTTDTTFNLKSHINGDFIGKSNFGDILC